MNSSARFNQRLLSTLIATCIATGAYAQSNEVEEVVVTGIKASLTNSVNIKRESGSVVDAISAEDIGKLPDTTIADSLQRVSGVQIRRSAGEGSTVNVRGLPQVSTLLNGEQYISAGSITTLQPNFADIPAELLSGVDVLKSAEAKTLSAGVAGTINLKTRRPLELDEGWTYAGSIEGTDGSYTDDTGTKLSAFAGFNNEDFGAVFTATKSDATLADYRYGMFNDWWWRGYHEDNEAVADGDRANWPGWSPARDVTGDGDTNDALFGTIDYGVTNRTTERERTGFSASFQYQANEQLELLADVFYTTMDQYERTNGLVADNAWTYYDWISPTELTNRGPSAEGLTDIDLYTTSVFDLNAVRVTAKAESKVDKRDSTNINLQANFQFTDTFKGSARYLHGEAEASHTGDYADAFITSGQQQALVSTVNGVKVPVNPQGEYDAANPGGRITVHADMSGKHPSFAYPSDFGDRIEEYALVSTFSEHNHDDEASLDVLRFDGSFEFDNGGFDFGYRYAQREVSTRDYDLAAPFTRNSASGQPETAYAKWKDTGISISAGGDTIGRFLGFNELQNMGYIHQVSDFGPAAKGQSYYFIDPKSMDNAAKFQNSLYPGNVEVTNWARSYELDEDSHTLYFQANIEGELGLPYQANFGMQAVHNLFDVTNYGAAPTSTVEVDGKTYTGISGTPGPLVNTTVTERHTTDFLPRVNVAVDVAEDQKVRFAYTKTMTQLDANDLGLGLSYTTNFNPNINGGVFQVVKADSQGNPNMEPWRSDNLDLSWEWYFADLGLVSVGLYYLDIESFIGTSTSKLYGVPDLDGVVRNNGIDLTSKTNVEGGSVQGFEVSYQQAYDFLPGLLSGLGSTINYTYSESTGGDKDFYGKTMPMADNSEDQANIVLWYELDNWQGRVAYNYRSERYMGKPWNDGHPMAWWSAPTSYVDASISYDFTDNLTVYLQGQNITEEFESTYMQWEDVTVSQNVYEARYTLGVRAKF
ncbi:MAG TPA: TonB-dependent receptor [Cellvibrio sp.]|nr:TonB-dependent receptor [Cellvibrio sp.]